MHNTNKGEKQKIKIENRNGKQILEMVFERKNQKEKMKEGIVSLLFEKVKKKSQIRNKNIKATKLKFVKKKRASEIHIRIGKTFLS